MAWYWWVCIGVAVVGIGYLKIQIWNRIQEKRKKAHEEQEED